MQADEIRRILPTVFQLDRRPDGPLEALLQAMDALHQPVEHALDDLATVIDPRRADVRFLPMLARWADLEWLLPDVDDPSSSPAVPGEDGLRDLIASAPALSASRGTADGLRQFLELAVGQRGFVIDDDTGEPFHIRVTAPATAASARDLIARVVAIQKPAHVTAEVVVSDTAAEEPATT